MQNTHDSLSIAITENSKWVNAVFISGIAFCLSLLSAKFLGVSTFKWRSTDLDISDIRVLGVVCLIFTGSHWYASKLLLQSVLEFWKAKHFSERFKLFEQLRASGGVLMRGFLPRERKEVRKNLYVYRIRSTDPTIWIAYGSVLVIIISITSWQYFNSYAFWKSLFLSTVTAFMNWHIGSNWVVALTELTYQKKGEAHYLNSISGDDSRYVPSLKVFKSGPGLGGIFFLKVTNLYPFTLDKDMVPAILLNLVTPFFLLIGSAFLVAGALALSIISLLIGILLKPVIWLVAVLAKRF